MFETVTVSLGSLALVTCLKERGLICGAYFMWCLVRADVSNFAVAFVFWSTRIAICGIEDYGYSLAFIVTANMALSSIISLPWFEFEYEMTRTINWADLKLVLFNFHYVFMLMPLFYAGLCCSFRAY